MSSNPKDATRLDGLLGDRKGWQLVETLISSEQIPPDRIADIHRSYPDFHAWMKRRNPERWL